MKPHLPATIAFSLSALLVSLFGTLRMSIPPLRSEQPLIDSIFRSGETVVVTTVDFRLRPARQNFWRLDKRRATFVPFDRTDTGETISAIASDGQDTTLAVATAGGLEVWFADGSRKRVPYETQCDGTILMVTNSRSAFLIIANGVAVVSRASSSRFFAWADLVDSTDAQLGPPGVALATRDLLFLGYDHGEWGGGAIVLAAGPDGSLGRNRKLLGENVRALVEDAQGTVWIATGMSHLSIKQGALWRFEKERLTCVFAQAMLTGDTIENSGAAKEARLALGKISGLTINASGDLLLTANRVGIIRLSSNGRLEPLWRGELDIPYRQGEVNVVSSPQGIVESAGTLLVATRSLGVLRFERNAAGLYEAVAQVGFADR